MYRESEAAAAPRGVPRSRQQVLDELFASRKAVYQRAHGLWPTILAAAGINEQFLRRRKSGPCPICQDGVDRYTFDDRFGDGDYVCRSCGAGKGLTLLMKCSGRSWAEAADWVLAYLADSRNAALLVEQEALKARAAQANVDDEVRKARALERLWGECQVVREGDPVHRYLSARVPGLQHVPECIAYHPRLAFYTRQESGDGSFRSRLVGTYAGMVSRVVDPDGRLVSLHRTYLSQDGTKAHVVDEDGVLYPDVKKMMPALACEGFAVVLAPGSHRELGVAEGIETSLAAHVLAGVPTWALVSTSGMRRFQIPPWVTALTIFADNDPRDRNGNRPGYDAAYALAQRPDVMERVKARTLRVAVRAPAREGTDIADLLIKLAHKARA